MNFEYLIFNLLIISGPFALSFDKKVAFYQKWKYVFPAIILTMIPFIVWDIIVTERHWWFNEQFTTNIELAGIPLGEWLFFVTVPYATLFVWEVFAAYFKNRKIQSLYMFRKVMQYGIIAGVILFLLGKEYTGLVFVALGITAILDQVYQTNIYLQKRMIHLVLLNLGLTLTFNGYLTARPVVLYDVIYQLNWRIYTIPIEDFGYGVSLILLLVIIYEKLKGPSVV